MLAISLAIATLLSLSAGTAMAAPAAGQQQTQIALATFETRASNPIPKGAQLDARGGNRPEATADADATQLPAQLTAKRDYYPQLESISRGTEP
jgi:hypothetical protein